MSYTLKTIATKFVSGFVGLATAVTMVGGAFAHTASAQTVDDLQAQISSLLATIQSLQAQLASLQGGGGSTPTTGFTFTRNLTVGSSGQDVLELQKLLNQNPDTTVGLSGAGSPGSETQFFGPKTKDAVVRFQNKYASEVLTPLGLSAGTGYVGPSTRAKLNTMTTGGGTVPPPPPPGGGTPPPGGGTPPPSGTDLLTVTTASQPSNSLAPQSAARVPFTKVTLTAGSQNVTVNGINIKKNGLINNSVFSGVVLLDENMNQVGISKTLNSNNEAKVGETITIPAGTSRTFTIGGNMASSLSSYAGQVGGLSVTGVDTSTPTSGTFPINGAMHTVNATLSIGSVTTNRSSLDPNASASKEIGTTGYTFSAIRVTAGSAEEVFLNSVRWNQTGSASKNDLSNVKVYVDGVAFDTTVSADGKYYTANLGGILIAKGLSKDISIKGDIISGSARTVTFDIDKTTDLNVSGKTYGYGITPSAGSTASASTASAQFTTGTPWYDAAEVTITGGSITTVTNSSTIPSQNVAVQVPNQPLGGFEMDVKGESISVQSLVFNFQVTGSGGQVADITNISIFKDDGSVVAGPVDGSGAAVTGTATFTDTITFPTGKSVYVLKGQLGSDFTNNQTIVASTTPSSNWTNVTGETTGNTITLSNGLITMNTMTVKAATTTVTVASSPSSQNVVMGVSGFTFATIQYDATASGEDVKASSQQYRITTTTGSSYPTNCFAWDGSTRLNNTAVNPTTDGGKTFTFDNNLTVPKGTVKTVDIKCDIPSNLTANDTIQWGINTADTMEGSGLSSGQTITFTHATNAGPTMTLKSTGSLTVTQDPSAPAYTIAAGGSTGNVVNVLKFRATNEDVRVEDIKLTLSGATASSSASDLTQVTLWDGATQVGSAIFTGSNTTATSSLSSTFLVPKDTDKLLTVKVGLSEIGTSKPGLNGHLVQIDTSGSGTVKALGMSSGSSIYTTSAATDVDGLRVFRSFPTIAKVAAPTNTLTAGEKSLLRFKVTADSKGDVGISKFTLRVATNTSATVDSLNVFAYTDSGFSSAVTGLRSDGAMLNTDHTMDTWASASTDIEVYAQSGSASTTLQIPAGGTRYFDVRGVISGALASGSSISTQLQGDAAYPSMASCNANYGCMLQASGVDGDTNDDFIWSPNATSTSSVNNADWTNGYGVTGLPSSNMTPEVLSK